jgi:RNA polymerase sigma-70 factor, ECF subfamily
MQVTKSELDRLFSLTYEELRRLAATVRSNEPGETLNPTALVNEAYLKLADSLQQLPASPLHFKRIAARAMRQVLVEAARRRQALKRGGGDVFVTLDEELDGGERGGEEVLALDAALEELARLNHRQAQIIELRFFGGFGLAEAAELLGVSESTLLRDWRAARAWLALELRRVPPS